jgi:hypothetical protein
MKKILLVHELVGFSTMVYRYLIFGDAGSNSLYELFFRGVDGVDGYYFSASGRVLNKFLLISLFCL